MHEYPAGYRKMQKTEDLWETGNCENIFWHLLALAGKIKSLEFLPDTWKTNKSAESRRQALFCTQVAWLRAFRRGD